MNFEQWTKIKVAYADAFEGQLDAAFEPSDQILLAEKTRHLFAHRAGMVDAKFKSEVELFPEYQNLEIGKRLRLTGPVVKERVDACLQCGANLLKGADKWAQIN